MTSAQGVLTGGSVAICGASAALALSAVLPLRKGHENFTVVVVVAVTLLSTVAMLAYPVIAKLFELPPQLAGLFIGGSIHDVAQVVGAGYALGAETGDVAIVVKLLRVSLLVFVVAIVALVFRETRHARRGGPPAGVVGAMVPLDVCWHGGAKFNWHHRSRSPGCTE